jgi:hypothetical protein
VAGGISYSEGLIQSLEKSLRSAFNRPYLRLTRKPRAPGGGFYVFVEKGDRDVQTDDGREQTVTAILSADGQPTPFYFAFVTTFDIYTLDHILTHASLMVFQDVYAGEITPLFRAEWDYVAASDTKTKHAQPHWHFVQRPERIERVVRTIISPRRDFKSAEESEIFAGLLDCGRIHFAMTSLGPVQKQMFQSDDFQKWFDSLAKYVSEQIQYLMSKAPAPALKDFVPDT